MPKKDDKILKFKNNVDFDLGSTEYNQTKTNFKSSIKNE